jgi:hypothetical protein
VWGVPRGREGAGKGGRTADCLACCCGAPEKGRSGGTAGGARSAAGGDDANARRIDTASMRARTGLSSSAAAAAAAKAAAAFPSVVRPTYDAFGVFQTPSHKRLAFPSTPGFSTQNRVRVR